MAASGEDERAVAGSGQRERAVAGSGEGERALAGSGEGERAVAGSWERELSPLQSMDDPCTARLRLHRLLAYLRGNGYGELYLAARRITPVIFHAKDLAKKVKEGKWGEATFYVNSFAPFSMSGNKARRLMQFLMDFNALEAFARDGCVSLGGTFFWGWLKSMYKKPVLNKYPCFATLVEDVVSKRDGHTRAFFDWQLVRNKAAKVAVGMASKTPELRGRRRDSCRPTDLHCIVPFQSRRCVKKSFGRKQPAALAHYYLQMKKRLPSSELGESLQKFLHNEQLIELFETSLEAGSCSVVKDRRSSHLPREGVPFATTAARRFMVTVTPRSSIQRNPQHSFDALKRTILQACRKDIAHPGAFGVASPSSQQHQPELSSGLAMKRIILQGSMQDSAHLGNPSKKQRTTGNDPSPILGPPRSLIRNDGTPILEAPHSLIRNEGAK